MAYDEHLADRIRQQLTEAKSVFSEKKMMGGICFLVDDKMAVGIVKDHLMVRIDPEIHEDALKKKGAKPMDFNSRPMKGFVFVDPSGVDMDADLAHWIALALEFNPRAKSSRKKKKQA